MKRWQADGLLLATAAIWGLAFVPQSWGMAHVGPFTFTSLRFALGALVVLPLALRERGGASAGFTDTTEAPRGLRAAGMAVLGGLLFLGAALQQVGMQTTSVTNAGFLTALYVPLVPLLGWLFFRRVPHWVVVPAGFGCVVGTWLLAGAHDVAMAPGDWWVIASSVPWALHVLFVGHWAGRLGTPYLVAVAQFLACSVCSLVVAIALESPTLVGLRQAFWPILFTGVVSVGVGFTAQVLAQRHTHAADAALILSSETVFAALFGALLVGDRLTPTGWAGCTVILLCILLAQWTPSRAVASPSGH